MYKETGTKIVFVLSLENESFCIDDIIISKKYCMYDNYIYKKIWEKIRGNNWKFKDWIKNNKILIHNPIIIISPNNCVEFFLFNFINRYGPNKVRGGWFNNLSLTKNELIYLRKKMFVKTELCKVCGRINRNCKNSCSYKMDKWGLII